MSVQESNKRTLVFSVALNGYQWLYRNYLKSHRRYAHRHGYAYVLIDRPNFTRLGVECCWLKLLIIRHALASGFDSVLFVDADAYIQDSAPPIESALETGKQLYMARGYSQRYNSGVIYANATPEVIAWLDKVIASRKCKVTADCDVGWGENGHMIMHAAGKAFIGELDLKWNNTVSTQLCDYIRHFNHGPMRASWRLRLLHKLLSRITRTVLKAQGASATTQLKHLFEQVKQRYPQVAQPD